MPKRQITPHKGGRTERLYIRILPEIKYKLERVAKERDMSVADLIELLAASLNTSDFMEE